MTSPKITLFKTPSTGHVEVTIIDTPYVVPGQLYIVQEGFSSLEDATASYRKEIAILRKRLEKANRAKKHIVRNMKNTKDD